MKVVLSPNPYRDRGLRAAQAAEKILRNVGVETAMCLPDVYKRQLKVLGRGYAIPQRSDGAVLRSAKEAMPGETLLLRMADGKVSCKVIEPAG